MFVKPQVLVVCPTAAGRLYLGVLLGRLWYQPLLAKTVEEAVHHAHRVRFAVIALDGDIPEDALRNAIAIFKTHPITSVAPLVVFTSQGSPTFDYCLSLGCESILPRPIDFSATYATFARLTGQVRRQARIAVLRDVAVDEELFDTMPVCTNLSEGGLFLRTHTPPEERTLLHLSFHLPQDTIPLAATASVVHRCPLGSTLELEPGAGLLFTELSEQDLLRIRQFVHHQTLGDLKWD